jgi:GNAT superfamily N-acetyltransferase
MMHNINIQITDSKISCEFGILDYSFDDDIAIVNAISVNVKRNGIGSALLQTFENMAIEEGCNIVVVPASLSAEALLFWKYSGYKAAYSCDKKRMNKIINSEYYPTWNDPQGVIELEKQLIDVYKHKNIAMPLINSILK